MSYYTAKIQLTDEIDTPKGVKIKKITEYTAFFDKITEVAKTH